MAKQHTKHQNKEKNAFPSIHISKGNIKTGEIPSFSLPSGLTCSPGACKTCYMQGCYARKIERLRKNVHRSYMENLEYVKRFPEALESYLNAYFSMPNAPKLFRIHVGGDFVTRKYFEMWLRVMEAHPGTKFLAFTKRDGVVAPYLQSLPQNFALVWSAWPGVPIPNSVKGKLPVAWMQDGTEGRVTENAVSCPGHCDRCAKCWATDGYDVVFHKH